MNNLNRRNFVKKTVITTSGLLIGNSVFTSIYAKPSFKSSDKVIAAVIGVRSRAKALTKALHEVGNTVVKYNCDVDQLILKEHNSWCQKNIGYVPKNIEDFRKALDDKDVDAVFIVTPEHWHAPMSIMALQAGKHVYVEKPCSHNAAENDLLIEAQKKYGKLVQMGNQQRSAKTSILAVQEIEEGIIGEVYKGEAYYSNNRGSIGIGKKVDVPKSLNWDLWQGPAPREQYRDNIHPYNWHWFRNWGTGEIHNNGTHEIDVCRWALGVDKPKSVTSFGGKYTYQDDWEFTDNQQVTYTFEDDKFITWTGHSRGRIQPSQPGRGATIYGSKGVITLSRNDYKLYDLDGKLIKTEKEKVQSETTNTQGFGGLNNNHVANFINGIRKGEKLRSPIADAGISTMLCHYGNIAQFTGKTIYPDSVTGKLDDKEAMQYWSRNYDEKWKPSL